MRRMLPLTLLCVLIAARFASAIPSAGILTGLVLDTNGTPAPAVRVSWQAADGTRPHAVRTDAQGRFRLASVRPGLYELRAEAKGMSSDWEHNVLVKAGFESSITLRMVRTTLPGAEISARTQQGRMREWTIPVEDALPQETAVDPLGRVWVTLMRANQLGRLDPATNQWKFFSVPTQFSGPRGLASDRDGNVWFAESTAGKIGRVDAGSGAVTEFVVAEAKDSLTAVFGAGGTLWFAAESANSITRLDTRTGETKSFAMPAPQAKPCGITPGPDGGLWFYEFGANKLARLDPATGAIAEFTAPEENTMSRGLAIVGRAIYFTGSAAGGLMRFDIDAKNFRSWHGPSGAGSQPSAIAADREGFVWYSGQGANTLIRFDPKTEMFESFPLPSADSKVHSMTGDSRGRIWLALSTLNKIVVIE